ncbi:sensor histidine kinase [Streptosporangium roseum]|uniref:Oxygen sensor histidine kinase NreB n=1 Tax=Streptosporangium roseum (strain ATCC 12428 / DSM 43021 / JCM 3005 / KCTC 9067 / NCIMB 10171 / NRRL 2505 / NI 9100) TaxID=479432 RepID=D2B2V2_STRRD|nr:histidine kinase [Streptosporangium roseum]ACZ83579.1 Signal transduction histidine kinase-like protein [Streptosporangium roseum DSM 43021]
MAVTTPPARGPGARPSGVHLVLNRTLVYGGLAVVTGGIYSGLTWLVTMLAGSQDAVAGLVAALSAGAVFHPARLRLQRGVDRLLRVERDPYRVADRLSRTLQEAVDPAEGLVTAAALVRQALRADGVAVEVHDGHTGVVVDGELGDRPVETPLVWHGEPVGRLLSSGSGTSPDLLDALARHLAELAHAVRLTADVRRSRERILTTREEERRRLRRDLHDGLGPTLASLAMTVDEARLRLERDPEAVEGLLIRVRDQMGTAIIDVRDLVYGLRPPALDDLGLVGSLRALADAPGPRVDIAVVGPLGDVPAAVEVAAYRIAQEALTNVRRHAQATTALVRVELVRAGTDHAGVEQTGPPAAGGGSDRSGGAEDGGGGSDRSGGAEDGGAAGRRAAGTGAAARGELRLSVADDGIGLPERVRGGVGLVSMRERAAEAGGSCMVGPRPGGGTEVIVRLPLETEKP